MFRIGKTVTFCASHQLLKCPADHQCARLHGHNYEVIVELECSSLDSRHWIVDFGAISDLIKKRYDHQHLNEMPEFDNQPTAEMLAKVLFDLLEVALLNRLNMGVKEGEEVRLTRVRVSETPGAWAEFAP